MTERFLLKCRQGDGCWDWIASKHPNGYGQVWNGERVEQAHRVAFRPVGSLRPSLRRGDMLTEHEAWQFIEDRYAETLRAPTGLCLALTHLLRIDKNIDLETHFEMARRVGKALDLTAEDDNRWNDEYLSIPGDWSESSLRRQTLRQFIEETKP